MLTDTSIDLNVLWRDIKGVEACQGASTRSTRKLEKDDDFRRVLLSGGIGTKYGCGSLFMKDVTEVLRKQVEVLEKMILRSVQVMKTRCQEPFTQL